MLAEVCCEWSSVLCELHGCLSLISFWTTECSVAAALVPIWIKRNSAVAKGSPFYIEVLALGSARLHGRSGLHSYKWDGESFSCGLQMAPGFLKFLHDTYFLLVAPSSDCLEYFWLLLFCLAILAWFLREFKLVLSTLCLALLPPLHTSTPKVKRF